MTGALSRPSWLQLATIGALFFATTSALAGDAEVWTTLTANAKLSDRWSGQVDFLARAGDGGDDDIYEVRYGAFLSYRLTRRVLVSVGYTRVHRDAGSRTRTEERPRQQVAVDFGNVGPFALSTRLRLEQRFRSGGGIGWRLRPQVRVAYLLSKSGTAAVVSHEGFVALDDTGSGQRAGYERMRNFIGMAMPLSSALRAELGYLNQYNFGQGDLDTVDHVGSLALTLSL